MSKYEQALKNIELHLNNYEELESDLDTIRELIDPTNWYIAGMKKATQDIKELEEHIQELESEKALWCFRGKYED